MKTVNEHINMIEEHLQAYKPTNDFSIPSELILGYMNVVRAAIIRQEKLLLDSSYYQMVDCLEVECVERGCVIAGYHVKGGGIKRVNLPNLVSGIAPYDIRYLGGMDLETAGTRLSVEGFVNFKYTRWTKNMFHYCVIGNEAYIRNLPTTNNDDTKRVTGILLLDNPVDACNWTDDTLYPCPSDYRLQVLTIQHILTAYRIYPDEMANTKHDIMPAKQPQQQMEDLEDEDRD